MNRTFRIAALVAALSVALVLPGATLAATSDGTTTESLDIAATISMTVPASITYTQGKALNSTDVTLTNLDTDNPTGMTVSIKVNADASGKIPVASRSFANGPAVGGWTQSATTAVPSSSTAADILYYGGNNPSNHSVTFASKVDASAFSPGSFTGSLIFHAFTN